MSSSPAGFVAAAVSRDKHLERVLGRTGALGILAFAGCENLRAIYLMSPTPIDLTQAAARGIIHRANGTTVSQFDGVDFETCVLHVPYGSGDLYRQAGGWKLFKHIVEMEETGISSATLNDKAEKTNDEWYDLNGCRLNGQPTRKGVYIQKGKKHVF